MKTITVDGVEHLLDNSPTILKLLEKIAAMKSNGGVR